MSTRESLTILATTLREKGYRLLSMHPGSKATHVDRFDVYVGPAGNVLIVQVYKNHCGFEVYGPLEHSNNLDATLAAIP